jgi:hypothetical protein
VTPPRRGTVWRDSLGRTAIVEGACSRSVRFRRQLGGELLRVATWAFLARYQELAS